MKDITKHKHWPVMQPFFKALSDGRLLQVEWFDKRNGKWRKCEYHGTIQMPNWYSDVDYRLAPETILVNGIEVPAPDLLEALQVIATIDPVDAALDPQRAIQIARAAIAKALGESDE